MAKRYFPTLADKVHENAVYMTRYNSTILAALAIFAPEAIAAYTTLRDAVLEFDALREQLTPVIPDAPTE